MDSTISVCYCNSSWWCLVNKCCPQEMIINFPFYEWAMSRKLDSIEQQKTNHRLSSSFVKFYKISIDDLKGLKKAQNDLKVFYKTKIMSWFRHLCPILSFLIPLYTVVLHKSNSRDWTHHFTYCWEWITKCWNGIKMHFTWKCVVCNLKIQGHPTNCR